MCWLKRETWQACFDYSIVCIWWYRIYWELLLICKCNTFIRLSSIQNLLSLNKLLSFFNSGASNLITNLKCLVYKYLTNNYLVTRFILILKPRFLEEKCILFCEVRASVSQDPGKFSGQWFYIVVKGGNIRS